MGQLVLNLNEEDVEKKLAKLAHERGQSIEQTALELLRTAVSDRSVTTPSGLGSQLAELFRDCPLDEPIQEIRGWNVKPPEFAE